MRHKLVLTHWVHQEVIDYLESEGCQVITNDERSTLARSEVLHRAQDADGLMAFMPDRIDAEFLDACPRLRVVGAALKGYDNLDTAACTARGVWLTMVPDLLTEPTAELTHALMLALARNLLPSDDLIRAGEFHGWTPSFYGRTLIGARIGILGMGAVGRAFARLLLGYRADLRYHDLQRLDAQLESELQARFVTRDELLASSEFLAVILPLNESTRHAIDAQALLKMQPGAFLINTGRGSTVDEEAVAAALTQGQLAGYAADVYEFEDWARADRPRTIHPTLVAHADRTVLSTHIGSAVDGIRRAIAMEAARNIIQALRGERPQGAVNEVANTT